MPYCDLRGGGEEERITILRCLEKVTRKALSNQSKLESLSMRLSDAEDQKVKLEYKVSDLNKDIKDLHRQMSSYHKDQSSFKLKIQNY